MLDTKKKGPALAATSFEGPDQIQNQLAEDQS